MHFILCLHFSVLGLFSSAISSLVSGKIGSTEIPSAILAAISPEAANAIGYGASAGAVSNLHSGIGSAQTIYGAAALTAKYGEMGPLDSLEEYALDAYWKYIY